MSTLQTLEIATGNDISASVIWLHGLGADGHDFAPVVEQLGLPHVRYVLPHAPQRPITLNGGYVMPAWYDLLGLEMGAPQDEAGIRATQREIEALIAREQARGIAAERIVLAGFSQGGAMALHTALRHPQRLGGVLALSTYLPLQTFLAEELTETNLGLPIFVAHGVEDSVISLAIGQLTVKTLAEHGYDVAYREYPMPHAVCPEEIADIRAFLRKMLP